MTAEAATNATVSDILERLDGDFAAMAAAFGNAAFALWVGSGISFGRAPDLGMIAARAIEFLRMKANDPSTRALFEPALRAAIAASQTVVAAAERHFATPFADSPNDVRKPIIRGL